MNPERCRARSPDNGERRERCCFHSLLCLWDWDGTRPAEAAAAPPRDRSLGITDEECSERTYIIGHIYADRVRTVVLACLRDGERQPAFSINLNNDINHSTRARVIWLAEGRDRPFHRYVCHLTKWAFVASSFPLSLRPACFKLASCG